MSPIGAIFVPFPLKTGTSLLHPLPPSIVERVRPKVTCEQKNRLYAVSDRLLVVLRELFLRNVDALANHQVPTKYKLNLSKTIKVLEGFQKVPEGSKRMHHISERLYCRNGDECPADRFHMAIYLPDFETEGSREN